MSPPSRDANEQAHILIARFLSHQNYTETLAKFLSESTAKNPQLRLHSRPNHEQEQGGQEDWNDIVEDWVARKVSQIRLRDSSSKLQESLEQLEASDPSQHQDSLPSRVKTVVKEATNVLNVKKGVLPRKEWDSASLAFRSSQVKCIFTTTVDRTLKIWSYPTRKTSSQNPLELLETHSFPSPVLTFAQHPQSTCERFVACGTMEGSLYVLDLVTREKVTKIKDHSKYIVKAVWSPDGRFLATIGYDKLVHVYSTTVLTTSSSDDSESGSESPSFSMSLVRTLHPRTNPEAAIFLPDSSHLVWTARDDHLLHYLSIPSSAVSTEPASPGSQLGSSSVPTGSASPDEGWTLTEYNLNPNQDSFTSFSILSMTIHPTLPLLSLQTSTNSPRVLLYPFHSSNRLRTIHLTSQQSDFFNPRHCWTEKGDGVVVNSEDGIVRLCSFGGGGSFERLKKGCHGIAAPLEDDEADEDNDGTSTGDSLKDREGEELKSERAKARRERDRGSSVIRDVEIVELESEKEGGSSWAILSAGFDKTVRMIV